MYETMAAQLDLWRAGRAGRRTQPDIPRHGKKPQISDAAALIRPAWNRSSYVFNSLLRTYYGDWRPVLCMKPGIEIKTTAIFLPLPSFSAGHDRRVFTGRSIKLEHLCASRSSRGISSSGISTITSRHDPARFHTQAEHHAGQHAGGQPRPAPRDAVCLRRARRLGHDAGPVRLGGARCDGGCRPACVLLKSFLRHPAAQYVRQACRQDDAAQSG